MKECSVNTSRWERGLPFVLSDEVNEIMFKLKTARGCNEMEVTLG